MDPPSTEPPNVASTVRAGQHTVELSPHALMDRLQPIWPVWTDLIAGISVFLILIPQGLAYAELSGMPPHLGLIAGVFPPIAAAFFVSSPYLQTGPTALTALLVLGSLAPLAAAGTPEYVKLGAQLALMVGVLRIGFGLLRLGIIAYFVSQPVLIGFTTGAALLITATQVPAVLGVAGDGDRVATRALDAIGQAGSWSTPTLFIAALTFALTIGLRRVHPLFPSVLVAVAVSWVLTAVLNLDVATIGSTRAGFPSLSFNFASGRFVDLIIPAVVIALIGFVEPASIARGYATAKRERWSANQEFLSQGVANLAASVTGTFPVGGSLGRSSLNERLGARSRWSGAVTGLTMLAFLPFVGLLETIPRAALAAVVITAAVSLVRFDRIVAMWKWSKPQTGTAIATLAATFALDPRIDRAILFGVGLSVAIHLWRETQVWVAIQRIDETTLRIAPQGVIWFASINRVMENALATVADNKHMNRVIIDLEGVGRLDLTAAALLADFASDLRDNGVEVRFDHIPPHAKRIFDSLLRAPGE